MICHDTLRLTADRHPYVAWMDSPPVSRVRQSLYIVAGCTSTTRAFNLYRQAGVALDVFTARLGEARAITQEQTAAIRARVDDGTTAFPRKNKMAYFFAVLEDLLGVREGRADAPEETGDAADERPPVRFGQLPRRR